MSAHERRRHTLLIFTSGFLAGGGLVAAAHELLGLVAAVYVMVLALSLGVALVVVRLRR